MRTASLILFLAALVPLRGTAQPVAGVVVEEGAGTPVPGAMVILRDSTGTQVRRVLTNAAGRFLVLASDPGPHTITVERIGYADWATPSFEPRDLAQLITIRVPVQAIALEGLDVAAGRRCEVRPEEGKATARVWEEVRKALAAEEYTREVSGYRYTLVRYRRELDRNARDTIEETSTLLEDQPAAFQSFPIEHLVTRGFVQMVEDSAVYYAPDAGALLSDAFLDTHCFGLRQADEAEAGRIGLVFNPLEDREVPEIGGVLWVDAATSELERLEFAYLNLIRSRQLGEPGGEVAFTRLPDGTWIVREWRLRMPHLERAIGGAWHPGRGFARPVAHSLHGGCAGRFVRGRAASRRDGRLPGPHLHGGGFPGEEHDRRCAVATRFRLLPRVPGRAARPRGRGGRGLVARPRRCLRHRHDHHRLARAVFALRCSRGFAPARERARAAGRRSGAGGDALHSPGSADRGGESDRSGSRMTKAGSPCRAQLPQRGSLHWLPESGALDSSVPDCIHWSRPQGATPGTASVAVLVFAQDPVSRPMSNPSKRR